MVLILASEEDIHAKAVRAQVERSGGGPCVVLDTEAFPQAASIHIDPSRPADTFVRTGSIEFHLGQVRAIWHRRVRYWSGADAVAPEHLEFAQKNTKACIAAFLVMAKRAGVLLVNDPDAELLANEKSRQLAFAEDHGFVTPRTVMTNDPQAVVAFARELKDAGKRAIQKPVKSVPTQGYTAWLDEQAISQLHRLSVSPMQFQEYIEGEDLRVTVVGDAVLAAYIRPRGQGTDVDWRKDVNPDIEPCELSPDTKMKILSYTRTLGLTYGAFDFKVRPDRTLVFLEVNPAGQFLFVEILSGLDISGALAAVLNGRARA